MWAGGYFTGGYWPRAYFPRAGGSVAIGPIAGDFRRERYYAALWSKLLGLKLGGLVLTASRKVANMEDLQPANMPALYMDVGKQTMKADINTPPIHTLRANIYLYAANPNTNSVSADMVLNGLIDGVQAALAPPPGFATQTLGETVHAVWMGQEQEIEVFAGVGGQRAAAIVPVEIMVFQ